MLKRTQKGKELMNKAKTKRHFYNNLIHTFTNLQTTRPWTSSMKVMRRLETLIHLFDLHV